MKYQKYTLDDERRKCMESLTRLKIDIDLLADSEHDTVVGKRTVDGTEHQVTAGVALASARNEYNAYERRLKVIDALMADCE